MQKLLTKLAIIITLVCSIGCDKIVLNAPKVQNTSATAVVSTANASIYDSMVADKVSKEDAEILYKNFRGLAEYLPHTKKLDNTVKVFQLVKDFQMDYNYSRGSYKGFTDAVEKFLTDAGYKKAKKIVDADAKENEVLKSQVTSDIRVIADSVEKYLRGLK